MREVLEMLGDARDAVSEALRREASQKLDIFLGWLDGTRPKPSDEERRELVREVTTLYRKAKTHAARYDDELSDESTERLVDPGAEAEQKKKRSRSASGE